MLGFFSLIRLESLKTWRVQSIYDQGFMPFIAIIINSFNYYDIHKIQWNTHLSLFFSFHMILIKKKLYIYSSIFFTHFTKHRNEKAVNLYLFNHILVIKKKTNFSNSWNDFYLIKKKFKSVQFSFILKRIRIDWINLPSKSVGGCYDILF